MLRLRAAESQREVIVEPAGKQELGFEEAVTFWREVTVGDALLWDDIFAASAGSRG
jgi:hypothetical protein